MPGYYTVRVQNIEFIVYNNDVLLIYHSFRWLLSNKPKDVDQRSPLFSRGMECTQTLPRQGYLLTR